DTTTKYLRFAWDYTLYTRDRGCTVPRGARWTPEGQPLVQSIVTFLARHSKGFESAVDLFA
ncbi:hypothetical protein COCMIDRAFT_104454, partial [Bipolaris oryzae ATCC 44560]